MKILRTTATFYPHVTGPAYQAYKISERLTSRGHCSPIVSTDVVPEEEEPGYPPEMDNEDSFPFEVIRRKCLGSFDQYRMAPQVIFDYFHQSPDVVHCHGYRNALKDIFYLGNLVDSKPLVIHGHGTFLGGEHDPTTERSYQYELYDRVWSRTLDRADAVVVSSKQEFNEGIEFGINKNKLWTIPVGKEPDTFTSIPRNPPDDYFRILFVGRLAPRRNLEMLISSVAELKSYDIELRIVGGEGAVSNSSRSNYVDELKQLVAEENLEDMVTLTGPKYGRELISEYRSADVFANPTHYENFGQANLEAAFSGLPLLSTPTGVALDLIDEDETGYFFETTAGLSDILSSIISDKEQVNSMSENILLKARSGYSWEPIIDQYLELYEHVMS